MLDHQFLWPCVMAAVHDHRAHDCRETEALAIGGVDLVAHHMRRLACPDHLRNCVPEQLAKGVGMFYCTKLAGVEVLYDIPAAASKLPHRPQAVEGLGEGQTQRHQRWGRGWHLGGNGVGCVGWIHCHTTPQRTRKAGNIFASCSPSGCSGWCHDVWTAQQCLPSPAEAAGYQEPKAADLDGLFACLHARVTYVTHAADQASPP